MIGPGHARGPVLTSWFLLGAGVLVVLGVISFWQRGPVRRAESWQLGTEDGALGMLEQPGLAHVRAEIFQTPGGDPFDIQLYRRLVPVRTGQKKRLRFRARSDEPRTVKIWIQRIEIPFDNLGLDVTQSLVTEWREFDLPLTIAADDGSPRVVFALGGIAIPVEVADLVLEDDTSTGASADAPVQPEAGSTLPSETPIEHGDAWQIVSGTGTASSTADGPLERLPGGTTRLVERSPNVAGNKPLAIERRVQLPACQTWRLRLDARADRVGELTVEVFSEGGQKQERRWPVSPRWAAYEAIVAGESAGRPLRVRLTLPPAIGWLEVRDFAATADPPPERAPAEVSSK